MLLGNGLAVGNVWGQDGALTSRQLTSAATGTDLSHLSYRYDADGNIGAITDHLNPAASVIYGYDPAGRLVLTVSDTAPVAPQSYSYTSGTNQLASFSDSSGTRSISYDARGNTVAESRPGGVTVAAGYDGYGRLISYARSNTGAQSYTYNGLDDRVRVDKPTGTRTFVYDADGRVMGEYGASASDVKAEFIWGLPSLAANDNSPFGGSDVIGGYTPLAVASPAGSGPGPIELFWVHGNHLGVPIVYTNSTGAPVAPPGDYLLPGFPGQLRVMADLYYNRYRDYDPVTGRYIQADPIGLAGGANGYIYAGANPVNRVDPLGLFEVDPRYLPRTIPRPMVTPVGAGFMLIGAIAPTIIEALRCTLPRNTDQYDDFELGYDPSDPDDPCDQQLKRDVAKCQRWFYASGRDLEGYSPSQGYKACERQAMQRYGECLAGGAPRSPLRPLPGDSRQPWDTQEE
jgi:RHS repeat-associated protein